MRLKKTKCELYAMMKDNAKINKRTKRKHENWSKEINRTKTNPRKQNRVKAMQIKDLLTSFEREKRNT